MKRNCIFFLMMLMGIFGQAIADDPPTDHELQELVKNLDDSSRSTRLKARLQLLAIGPSVIDRLEKVETSHSTAGQSELKRIIQALKIRKTQVDQRLPELELPDGLLSLKQAVALLAEQTGYDLNLSADLVDDQKTVRFSSNKLSYWSAMIELLDQSQLDLTVDDSGRNYILTERKEPRTYLFSPTSVSNSVDQAYRINRVTRKEIAGRNQFDLLRINFQVLFAPSRHPIYLQISGDQNLELPPPANSKLGADRLAPYSPEAVIELPCHLRLISPEFRVDWLIPKTIHPDSLDLSLQIKTLEAVDVRKFVFQEWSSPRVSQRLGMAVVTREQFSLEEDSFSVLMLVLHSTRGAPFESHREWMSQTKLVLSDGTQELYADGPAKKVLEADGTTALRFTFPRPDSPLEGWKLKYQLPTDFRELQKSVRSRIDLKNWLNQKSDD